MPSAAGNLKGGHKNNTKWICNRAEALHEAFLDIQEGALTW